MGRTTRFLPKKSHILIETMSHFSMYQVELTKASGLHTLHPISWLNRKVPS